MMFDIWFFFQIIVFVGDRAIPVCTFQETKQI